MTTPELSRESRRYGGTLFPSPARIGSLCTGYGGLDLAIERVLGARTVWTAEIDKFARIVTEARFPVPNHGDIKTTDWADVEPIDILTAGYPCQPFSNAGRRLGADDPRHLWPAVRDAIRHLRPRLVVLENVQGHLRIGFPQVLQDLAELGFDAEWTVLRASDVGACHQRARLYVVAYPAGGGHRGEVVGGEADGAQPFGPAGRAGGSAHGAVADALGVEPERRGGPRELAGQEGAGAGEGSEWQWLRDALGHGAQAAADPRGERRDWWSHSERAGRDQAERCEAGHHPLDGVALPPYPDSSGREGLGPAEQRGRDGASYGPVAWGDYEPAIRRHEALYGAPPYPFEVGQRGKRRHDPRFVEWMMTVPPGWVTDFILPDTDPRPNRLSRSQALKILGNGVVPLAAAVAVNHLIGRFAAEEVAA